MANVILLAVCLLMGIFLRRIGKLPVTTPAALNGYVIYVALPAAAIRYLHDITLEPNLILTALMAWLLFGVGWLFFAGIARLFNFSSSTTGALVLVGGLGNTSFVGLPMIEAYYGKEYLGVGIIADQLGTFLVLSTFGVFAASMYSSGNASPRAMVRKVLMFPPFQALCLALLLKPIPFPAVAMAVLQKLADTIAPVALVSVGFQLIFCNVKALLKSLSLGLFYKLLLGPALVTLLYVFLMDKSGVVVQITLFEAAMPPMITAGIIAVEHDLEPQLVALMLGIGIPFSFLTLAGWQKLLAYLVV